ncbi:putative syntaxin [Cucurbita argyrosperma subsp. argyrosperma]|nr:putative syntaxin [Cucurbita argyrosperma subsp. argyrosperma]
MNDLLTDSFVSNGKGEVSRDIDIEKGTPVVLSNSDMGMEAFNKQIQEVEVQVDKLSGLLIKLKNLTNRQKPGCQKGTAIDRARMNMTNSLTKKFKDLMIEFQALRQRIQDEYREVVERRVITVTGTRPDETMIDELIETGNSEQIFQNAFEHMGRGMVTNAVDHVRTGTDALHTAKSLQKKSRKCMMIAIILLLVIALIIVLSVLKPWKK